MVLPVTGTVGGSAWPGPAVRPSVRARATWSRRLSDPLPSGRRWPPRRPTDRVPRRPARSSGGSSGRIACRVPETCAAAEPPATPDGSRGRARRAARHRPRDRRPPGRVARPARAAPDDRRRDEAGPARRCHDDPDRPRRPARDDRLGRHPGRRRRAAARLSDATRAGSARSCGPATCSPARTSASDAAYGIERYDGASRSPAT